MLVFPVGSPTLQQRMGEEMILCFLYLERDALDDLQMGELLERTTGTLSLSEMVVPTLVVFGTNGSGAKIVGNTDGNSLYIGKA